MFGIWIAPNRSKNKLIIEFKNEAIFNKLDFCGHLSTHKFDITDRRQVQLAYLIFNRADVFRDSLKYVEYQKHSIPNLY